MEEVDQLTTILRKWDGRLILSF